MGFEARSVLLERPSRRPVPVRVRRPRRASPACVPSRLPQSGSAPRPRRRAACAPERRRTTTSTTTWRRRAGPEQRKKETRMSAITAALSADRRGRPPRATSPPNLPDRGRSSSRRPADRSCCRTASGSTRRCLHGEPIDAARARAARHATTRPPAEFLRLIGPPGAGKSQIARAIAYRLWTRPRPRGRPSRTAPRSTGFVEMQPGPSSDEFFFRYDFVPVAERGGAGARWSTRRSCRRCARAGW